MEIGPESSQADSDAALVINVVTAPTNISRTTLDLEYECKIHQNSHTENKYILVHEKFMYKY